jgi:hypothetical protein
MSQLRVATKDSFVINGFDRVPTLTVDFVVIDDELQKKLLDVWQCGHNNHDRAVELLTELAERLAELLDEVDYDQ